MPYIDEGDPKQRGAIPPVVPIAAVVVASLMTPALWYFCYAWFGYSYVGALLGALAVGLAAKFTLRRTLPPLQVAAVVLLIAGSFAGYVWVDSKIWTPFMFGESAKRFSKDVVALLFIGFSAYLVFILATPRLGAVKQHETMEM